MDEITSFFKKLSSIATQHEISDEKFELLGLFVLRSYSKTCKTKEVNEARILFSRNNEKIENIPLTKEAPRKHVFRSVLQSS